MILNANHFDFSAEQNCYMQELSQLQHHIGVAGGCEAVGPIFDAQMPHVFTLRNCPADGQHRSFMQRHVDKDGSGEDTMGWRFEEADGPNKNKKFPLKVLIVND